MSQINSKEYWDERFANKSWDQFDGRGQSLFFAKIAYNSMPDFFTRDLARNAWTVIDLGCALGDGTAFLAKHFPSCRFIGQDFSPEAVMQASERYTNCEFAVANIYDGISPADVIFSSNTLEHLKNPNSLMERMCHAADKYVVLLLPLEDSMNIDEHINIFSLDAFPVHMGDFYLESYSIVDCTNMENTHWTGKQILIIYTNRNYRPEQMTLQDIHKNYCSLNEKRIVEMTADVDQYRQQLIDAKEKILQQDQHITEVVNLCNWRDHLLAEADNRYNKVNQECNEVKQQNCQYKKQINELLDRLKEAEQLVAAQKEECKISACLSAELSKHQKEITLLRKELEDQKALVENHRQLIIDNQNTVCDIHSTVNYVRNSKSYKLALLLRRCLAQLIKGNHAERMDFLRWTFAKLKKKYAGKPLHQFDLLHDVNCKLLRQSSTNHQVLMQQQCDNTSELIPKVNRQIFIFASVPFYDVGGGQRSAQLANAFNIMGYEVFYIFGFESTESQRENMYIPTRKHLHIDQYSLNEMTSDIRDDAVLIFEIPYSKFIPYLDYANAHSYATIYEHIDNWDSSLGCLFYNKDDFERFIHDVQHITVTARILGEKIEEAGRNDYLYSANAVDSSLFEPTRTYEKPDDLVIGKKTLLYFGSLWGEWFDWDLLIYVAEHCDCAINLIGDYQPIADRIKDFPSNFHFLGIKKHEDLPAYLHYSDIALLPFKNSIIGKYVSPLKIFEYIAMNKPVLATPLDDIMGYPNVVLSEDKQVWAETVNKGIEAADATIFTAENSWFARCNQILDYIGRPNTDYPAVSIIVLNRNNMKVIFRCVSSLLTFTSSYQCEIIVVDNDSTDGSYERLQEEFGDRIKLIRNGKNGCSSGRNLGVQNATGEMLFFLDSDQWIVGEHFMDAPLDLMCNDGRIGAVSWNAGWFNRDSYSGPIVDYLPNRGIAAPWVLCRTDIAYLATSGLMMKRSLFDAIGGFDEFYDPTCFEDTDLSLKIRHAGYELAYCPYMAIMHLPHQTTNSGNETHKKLMARNGTYFIDKWKTLDPKLLEYYLK